MAAGADGSVPPTGGGTFAADVTVLTGAIEDVVLPVVPMGRVELEVTSGTLLPAPPGEGRGVESVDTGPVVKVLLMGAMLPVDGGTEYVGSEVLVPVLRELVEVLIVLSDPPVAGMLDRLAPPSVDDVLMGMLLPTIPLPVPVSPAMFDVV